MKFRILALLGFAMLLAGADARADDVSCDPALPAYDAYCGVSIAGWQVQLSSALIAKPALATRLTDMMRTKLSAIAAAVPERRLRELRRTVFWVDDSMPGIKRMFYRSVAPSWPKNNGRPDAIIGGIHITDAEEFLRTGAKTQPWGLMHELAHAYHHVVLGYGNDAIMSAFRKATEGGLYQEVVRNNGRKEKAYALTNEREYFAELTEAYFGENDFYPFTRAELKTYDPVGYEAVRGVWEDPPSQPAYALVAAGCSSSGVILCCPLVGKMASVRGGAAAQLAIRNELDKPVKVSWVDFQGERKDWGEIASGALYKLQKSFSGHIWELTDASGGCLALFRLDDPTAFFSLQR